MKDQIAEMIAVSLKDLNFIFMQYITKLAERGFSPEEIREALIIMGYGWC